MVEETARVEESPGYVMLGGEHSRGFTTRRSRHERKTA
jgi:hypothetical protein